MGIKRKHSITLSSSPVSSASAADHDLSYSPTTFRPTMQDISMMDDGAAGEIDCWNSYSMVVDVNPKHLNSRTRKRVRDGRPDEDTVGEQTIHKLFLAQKQQSHCHVSPTPSLSLPRPPSSVSSQSSHTSKASHQPSIHSFFSSSLPHRTSNPPPPPFLHPSQPVLEPLKCDDCDRVLRSFNRDADAMDMETDVSNYTIDPEEEAGAFACVACERRVCDVCSVRDGESRTCLSCAMDGSNRGKKWIGGIGWM